MEKHLVLSLPDQQARSEILAFHLGQGFEPDMLMDVVSDLDGESGAHLELLAREARARARVLGRDIELQDVRASLPPRKKFTTEERYRLAVHEAGHALVALSIRYARNVTIAVKDTYDPAKGANIGGSAKYDAVVESLRTENSLMDRIAVALAGMAAEEVIFEDRSIGSGGGIGTDVEMASSLARLLVGSYGLGRFPTYCRRAEELSTQLLPGKFEDEASAILAAQYERVVAILEPEQEGLMALAKQALLNETVTIGRGDGV